MACPFAGNNGRCPYRQNRSRVVNGRIACRGNTAARTAAATAQLARIQQQQAEAAQAACGSGGVPACSQSIGAQLYGASTTLEAVPTACCDPVRGCCTYPIGRRSDYWPTFAHPRWLTCNQLYNRRGR